MTWLESHSRDKFLNGTRAAGSRDRRLRRLADRAVHPTIGPAEQAGLNFSGSGVLLAVYLLGPVVTRFLGRFAIRLAERLLQKAPGRCMP